MSMHTWDDGDCDANSAAVLHKLEEEVAVIEQLGDDHLAACINLQVEREDIAQIRAELIL